MDQSVAEQQTCCLLLRWAVQYSRLHLVHVPLLHRLSAVAHHAAEQVVVGLRRVGLRRGMAPRRATAWALRVRACPRPKLGKSGTPRGTVMAIAGDWARRKPCTRRALARLAVEKKSPSMVRPGRCLFRRRRGSRCMYLSRESSCLEVSLAVGDRRRFRSDEMPHQLASTRMTLLWILELEVNLTVTS